MTRTLLTLAAVLAATALAAACDNPGSTVKDLGPDAPACTVAASTDQKDACTRFQDTLCARHLECDLVPDRKTCDTWFAGTYGDCAKATGTLTAAQDEAFVACLCALPNASCQALEDLGAESAVTECGQF